MSYPSAWGESCILHQPSLQGGNGVLDGYHFLLAQTSGPAYANAMGLPYDPKLQTSDTVIPKPEIVFPWVVDNGSYLLIGPSNDPFHEDANREDQSGNPSIFIAAQSFNPKSPLANPGAFYGTPPDRLSQLAARYGQGLVLAGKALGSALGAAVSLTAALNTIATAGLGGISSLAAGIASSIGIATSATVQIASTAGAVASTTTTQVIATATTTAVGAVTGSTVPTLAASVLASLAVGGLAAVATAIVFGILTGLVVAFPAESPSLHITSLDKGTPVIVFYLENGKQARNVFIGSPTSIQAGAKPSFGHAQWADLSDVDAETFFAGLVFLSANYGIPFPGAPAILQLLWTRRVSSEGIAAFRAARTAGASVSVAIKAAMPFVVYTTSEAFLDAEVGKGQVPIPKQGNANALACLAEAHADNEARATDYLAKASVEPSLKAEIRRASGISRPTVSRGLQMTAQITLTKGRAMDTVNKDVADRLRTAFGTAAAQDQHAKGSTLSRVLKPIGIVGAIGAVGAGIFFGVRRLMK